MSTMAPDAKRRREEEEPVAGTEELGSKKLVYVSKCARRTINPIRRVVESMDITPNPEKSMIPLSIGDPTKFGNLKTPTLFIDAICEAVRDCTQHGYQHASGMLPAREAIAKYYTCSAAPLTPDDVIIASGCSGALEIAIRALMDEGDNILMPCPGFALYQTIAETLGGSVIPYPLDSKKNWEADLAAMKALITDKTRAILVNNPSNPCGSVYSKEHLEAIVQIAREFRLPILADEIYRGLIFPGSEFHSLAALSDDVPVLSVGGIAKEFLVPGFRVGWILVNDKQGKFAELRKGLHSLTSVILGPNSIVQAALPRILTPEDSSDIDTINQFKKDTLDELIKNAKSTSTLLEAIPGLEVTNPQGAMYLMVRIDQAQFPYNDDREFCQALLKEESVFVLPGSCFNIVNYFRVVFCAPENILAEACARIASFCDRHRITAA